MPSNATVSSAASAMPYSVSISPENASSSISGVSVNSDTASSPKNSIHTLCQIPVLGMYQHVNGLPVQLCLPRGITGSSGS